MNKARTEKVAVVDELKERVDSTRTAVVTEYRGMTVAEISELRRSLRAAGGDFKVYKNTLVRRAIAGTAVEPLDEYLVGPPAVTFVKGDVSAVAKLLRDFARQTPTLILKGGVVDGKALSVKQLTSLADLPSRDVLLAQFAGLIASPLRSMAGLLKAVPSNFAYGLKALVDAKGGVAAPASASDEVAETPAGVEEAALAASDDAAAPAAEVEVTDEAPEAEAVAEIPEASPDVASEPAE